ncbi:NAD(P)-dependent dehydrogenase (short-subunit alcohol dehydrogenase family) [Kribbella antiqua]|uniref:Probable oxidoreductase n=1 Tax=Kribbella antiqua TaxID=2512217 RepID=A0A4R2INC0_9ACTN|nr:SDR family NAD(P)-dependent oxidoreductase [Kribbella antiqua]TCO46287.1 NAD(P)-dependent dehydrogenase (short-subunit alcohol dehydrogenase family) [Kribbella antiqua]
MSRITTPFTHDSTAADVIAGVDLTGRRAVVTGGASGIGVETARALASAGAEVTLAVRNTAAGERTAADIIETTGNNHVFVAPLELADRESVQAFAKNWTGPLHILVNNAGVMAEPLNRTPEGWEHQFATNHLGHFGLTVGLHEALTQAGNARIVSVSSSAHLRSDVVFDDLHFDNRPYDEWAAYGQSKTANVLFAVEAAKRWASDGIIANALMPGGIRTALQRHVDPEAQKGWDRFQWKTTEQGASTSVLLAASPLIDGVTGRYFEDNNEAVPNTGEEFSGVAAYALDPESATRLWDLSEQLLAR